MSENQLALLEHVASLNSHRQLSRARQVGDIQTVCSWAIPLIVVCSIAVSVYASVPAAKPPAPVVADFSGAAAKIAQEFVKDELRCPATASFPAADAVRSGDGWRVTSYVDAQNGFAANVRTHWTATVKDCGFGRWELVSLQFGKN